MSNAKYINSNTWHFIIHLYSQIIYSGYCNNWCLLYILEDKINAKKIPSYNEGNNERREMKEVIIFLIILTLAGLWGASVGYLFISWLAWMAISN